jgi:hypothetical protein
MTLSKQKKHMKRMTELARSKARSWPEPGDSVMNASCDEVKGKHKLDVEHHGTRQKRQVASEDRVTENPNPIIPPSILMTAIRQ